MKNVLKFLTQVLKALPIVVELLEVFVHKSENTNNSAVRKSDKDIIDGV